MAKQIYLTEYQPLPTYVVAPTTLLLGYSYLYDLPLLPAIQIQYINYYEYIYYYISNSCASQMGYIC